MATDKLTKISVAIAIILVALNTTFRVGVKSGRSEGRNDVIDLLPRPQQAIVQRVLRSGIDEEQIKKCQKELKEAQAAIENARKAHARGDNQNALDWIINARGHLAKVNPKAFDITKLRAELQLVQRTMFSPRAQ